MIFPSRSSPDVETAATTSASSCEADVALLTRVGLGETTALKELYSLYSGPLYSFALRSLGDAGDAEEVVQDCFVRLWSKAADYDAKRSKPFTWAHYILRGLCIDLLRKRGRRQRINHVIPFLTEPETAPAIFQRDEINHILNAMSRIPEDDRRALEMSVYLGYTGREIASHLQEPLGTVKCRIRRSLARLRQLLLCHE